MDEQRPHFFDTLMPPGSDGKQITFGQEVFEREKRRAVEQDDWESLAQMTSWAAELKQLRSRRPQFRNGGFVYYDTLEITRIDIAIRHLSLADVQWRKKPYGLVRVPEIFRRGRTTLGFSLCLPRRCSGHHLGQSTLCGVWVRT